MCTSTQISPSGGMTNYTVSFQTRTDTGISCPQCASSFANMDSVQTVAVMCALLCSDTKNIKIKRVKLKEWMGTHSEHGLSLLQKESSPFFNLMFYLEL